MQDKSKFGYCACWGEIGGGLALFSVGMSLYHFQHNVCGDQAPDYVVIVFFAVGFQVLTLGISPFLKFQYLKHRVIDYKEVKKVLTNPHYVLILVICCHSGLCSAFQTSSMGILVYRETWWEFSCNGCWRFSETTSRSRLVLSHCFFIVRFCWLFFRTILHRKC